MAPAGEAVGTFVCDAVTDELATLKIELADGQALDNSGRLYVARSVQGPNAGVTKIVLGNIFQDGRLPISSSKVTKIVADDDFCNTAHLAWRGSDNHLFVSAETDGGDCTGVLGSVKNLTLNASGNVTAIADVITPGVMAGTRAVANCEGLAVIPANHPEFGSPMQLLFGEDVNSGGGGSRILRGITNVQPPPDPTVLIAESASFDKFEGFAMGDFNGTEAFGVYVAEQGGDEIHLMRPSGPGFGLSVYANSATPVDPSPSSAPGDPPLPVFDRPDGIVFDPYSGFLFVSEDDPFGGIWIIVPGGASDTASRKLVFAYNFATAGGPQGMSFPDSGVMLLSETGNAGFADSLITVVDGWRFKFNRGDANGDGRVDVSDPTFIQAWLFQGGAASTCYDAADANDDSKVDITDSVYLYNYLFQGGLPPPEPFFGKLLADTDAACTSASMTDPTIDPTIDLLGCRQYRANCKITF